jgi:hypothetical protein
LKQLKYHHLGIPTNQPRDGEKYLKDFKIFVSGFETSEYGIEWMRFEQDCPLPQLVKTVPHLAFAVDDIHEALVGKKVIVEPIQASSGMIVAFVEENGAPVEFLQLPAK